MDSLRAGFVWIFVLLGAYLLTRPRRRGDPRGAEGRGPGRRDFDPPWRHRPDSVAAARRRISFRR